MTSAPQFKAPLPVRRAVVLMYAGGAVGALLTLHFARARPAIRAAMGLTNATKHGREHLTAAQLDHAAGITHVSLVTVHLVGTLLWIAVALLCHRGHWWARILATLLAGVGILLTWGYLTRGDPDGWATFLSLIGTVVGVAAVVLLWQPDAGRYFPRVVQGSRDPAG